MRQIMRLAPYEEFARLRLRPLCPNDVNYKEEVADDYIPGMKEKKCGHYIQESIWGVEFLRWSERPDELAGIGVCCYGDYRNDEVIWPPIATPILSAIRLNLQPGLSYEETASRFATPPRWRTSNGLFAIFQTDFHTGGDLPYEINCGFMNKGKLDRILVYRLDIEMPLNEGWRRHRNVVERITED